MKKLLSIVFLVSLAFSLSAQDNADLASKLKTITKKGDYIILELRLNKEDEFRTMEGGKSSLARIAVYTGSNEGAELVSKGFEGMNSVVTVLNNLKQNGWRLLETYPIKGESLILTHYILERRK
ncbi:MAG: hypothetical protein COB15_07735 [Flavobacteriales bacterium]|nr:MAG: hypothetical protein COB15_07735 [Flavobacteriales bacterium]